MKTLFAFLLTIVSYTSPVSYEMTLAGNFGEPRPNHFHGGIDVKTDRAEGKIVRSIGDGYVCRISVDVAAFGKALYIRHPEGYTSFYAHLKEYTPEIEALVKKQQYLQRSYSVDFDVSASQLPVAQGQIVAVSGNSGASQAPHLHLEILDNKTGNMLDPLEFLGDCLKDHVPPVANAIMVYPQAGKGVFNGDARKKIFNFTSGKNIASDMSAWGKVGFAIRADDYMEYSGGNKYGVRHLRLLVDGVEVYSSNVNDIPLRCNRMVNSWSDFEYYQRTHLWFLKNFKEPGNSLPFLVVDDNRGIVNFAEERDYHFRYILSDYFGNTSEYTFTVRGKKSEIPAYHRPTGSFVLRYDRGHVFVAGKSVLTIPQGLLADDTELIPDITQHHHSYSSLYRFSRRVLPLFNWATLSISPNRQVAHPEKLYIVSPSWNNRFMGGTYANGRVTARVRNLEQSYCLDYDDCPPAVSLRTAALGSSRPVLTVRAENGKSGMASLEGYIDDHFVLFEPRFASHDYVCDLRKTPIRPTRKKRMLRIKAVDNRDNESNITIPIQF